MQLLFLFLSVYCLSELICGLDDVLADPFYSLFFSRERSEREKNLFVKNKKIIILNVDRLGLMNRMRSVVDWYSIAQMSNRRLFVNWRSSYDCNVEFRDLFEKAPKELTVLRYHIPVTSNYSSFILQAANRYNFSVRILENDEELWNPVHNFTFFASKQLMFSSQDIIVTSFLGRITFEDIPSCHYYFSQHSNILSQFIPKIYFTNIVNQVLNNFFQDSIPVGIHLRIHDSRYDWEIVPPKEGTLAQNFGDGATINDFITIMNNMETSFPSLPNQENSTLIRFFIASNDFRIKQEILKYFPTAITLSQEISRETLSGMDHAFIEWLILSRMSLLIHTYGSSFASEASLVNNIPLVGIWEGNAVYYQNSYLKYCGDLKVAQFMRRDIQSSPKIVYYEGDAVNKRKVYAAFYCLQTFLLLFSQITGYLFRHSNCPFLSNWKIKGLKCLIDEEEQLL
jgi:hypothetical protein